MTDRVTFKTNRIIIFNTKPVSFKSNRVTDNIARNSIEKFISIARHDLLITMEGLVSAWDI